MNFVLDTNIIIRYPEILGKNIDGINFYVSKDVLQELSKRDANAIKAIILNKLNPSFKIEEDNQSYNYQIETQIGRTLNFNDFNILRYAFHLNKALPNVFFASDDKIMSINAKHNGIRTLNLSQLKQKLSNSKNEVNEAQNEVEEIKRANNKKLVQGILLGVFISILGFLIYSYIDEIVRTINIWGTILLIMFSGVGLFIFREKYRLSYGIAEFFTGIIAVVYLFPSSFDYNSIDLNLNFGLKLFASLYIMVRGQDNILKVISGTKIGGYIENKIGKKAG